MESPTPPPPPPSTFLALLHDVESKLPAPLKSSQFRIRAAFQRFRAHYAEIYGPDRIDKLLAALAAPTVHAAVLNAFVRNPLSIEPENLRNTLLSSQDTDTHLTRFAGSTISVFLRSREANSATPFLPPSDATHYLLDVASVLPAIALDLKPGQRVLDLCAAPGGKSVVMAQHLHSSEVTSFLHSNEFEIHRYNRLDQVISEYLTQGSQINTLSSSGNLKVVVSNVDATDKDASSKLGGEGSYDRVLVDAPCSSERHLLHSLVKGISSGTPDSVQDFLAWTPQKSSSMLAKTQKALLKKALAMAKSAGGRVVYATCSLSPEENDGVVKSVVNAFKGDKEAAVSVVKPKFEGCEELGLERTKYGVLVLPDRKGWGPIYCAVLRKGKQLAP